MLFINRHDAGNQLGEALLSRYKDKDIVVYAVPRGGVVVAAQIARALHAPLDLIFAHKIGHPDNPEYAIGAVSESGFLVGYSLNDFDQDWLEWEKEDQIKEIKRKRSLYLKDRPYISPENKIAILVDDGIATGLTIEAGIKELKSRHPSKIVVAIPVSPKSVSELIKGMVDEVVGIEIEDEQFLGAVGAYYHEFNQVEDQEVIEILKSQNN
jgi:predicted phosphoribosyltransferase